VPITITITDGTVTAPEIVIPDNRAKVTAAALSAAVGDTDPPGNDARAIRAALARCAFCVSAGAILPSTGPSSGYPEAVANSPV
jgi:hypothetical protein